MALVVRGGLSLHWDRLSLGEHPVSVRVRSLRSRKELDYSLSLRTLDTNGLLALGVFSRVPVDGPFLQFLIFEIQDLNRLTSASWTDS